MAAMDCAIDCEPLNNHDDIAATPCGHVYHRRCILSWLKTSSSCPQCRKIVTASQLIRLYLSIDDGVQHRPRIRKVLPSSLHNLPPSLVEQLETTTQNMLNKAQHMRMTMSTEMKGLKTQLEISNKTLATAQRQLDDERQKTAREQAKNVQLMTEMGRANLRVEESVSLLQGYRERVQLLTAQVNESKEQEQQFIDYIDDIDQNLENAQRRSECLQRQLSVEQAQNVQLMAEMRRANSRVELSISLLHNERAKVLRLTAQLEEAKRRAKLCTDGTDQKLGSAETQSECLQRQWSDENQTDRQTIANLHKGDGRAAGVEWQEDTDHVIIRQRKRSLGQPYIQSDDGNTDISTISLRDSAYSEVELKELQTEMCELDAGAGRYHEHEEQMEKMVHRIKFRRSSSETL